MTIKPLKDSTVDDLKSESRALLEILERGGEYVRAYTMAIFRIINREIARREHSKQLVS